MTDWLPTRALRRAATLILGLLVAAVVTGRVDLVVLAAPFVLGTALALRRRPRQVPRLQISTRDPHLVEGSGTRIAVTVTDPDEAAYDLAVVRTELPRWVAVRDGGRALGLPVRGNEAATIPLPASALRWGWHRVGPARAYAVACDALVQSRPVEALPLRVKVFPRTARFSADDAMPKAAGLVGAHRSRRYGDGGELAGIRQFVPGDRLRRIDWRSSLRTGELHVAQTLSDRDAEVVLLLDVLHEAGESGGIDGAASVLDTTVRAAAGIAQHYLGRGDRVMLVEYGGRGRALRPGSGRRHHLAALEWLLAVTPGEQRYGHLYGPGGRGGLASSVLARYRLPSSALLVVLTPLLETRSVASLAELVRGGRPVIAVDTLPEHVSSEHRGRWSDVAYRLWQLERENTVGQLLEHGVPTVAWAGAGSLDQVLRDVSRMAAAPR